MELIDIFYVLQWWLVFFVIGLVFLPLTFRIFSNFFDKGYIFSKILGIALISYVVFLLGILKILPFTEITILIVVFVFIIINILIFRYPQKFTSEEPVQSPRRWPYGLLRGGYLKIFLFEEVLFLATLFFWSYVRAHQPEIHGLEKYMDFGFINSIMRSEYFPPPDMWFTPLSINYYYFGHLVTAVLTKMSTIPSFVTFNLMLSTLFAFTFTGAFSIGANLIYSLIFNSKFEILNQNKMFKKLKLKIFLGGFLSGFLVSLAGNLHTIYSFFKPYVNENPVPFWQLAFAFDSFPNGYWYPNATRFIFNTIHEFPIYSAVVSDLHGHYLDVPFVLLTIAVLFSLINNVNLRTKPEGSSKILRFAQNEVWILLLLAFLLAIMYMTNAWDGIIYFLLTATVFFLLNFSFGSSLILKNKIQNSKFKIQNYNLKVKILNFDLNFCLLPFAFCLFVVGIVFFIFSLPFNLYFKPFASGVGVLCAPEFLTNVGNFGPFLFEADHCQHSPWWQLLILYGVFYFWAISFIVFIFGKRIVILRERSDRRISEILRFAQNDILKSDLFVLLLIIFSTFLIILPEFIYVKDIYPGHYRANTMFKLVYQAFILLSLSSGYIIVRSMSKVNGQLSMVKIVYWIIGFIGLLLVSIYPYFAINSYYGELKTYRGLDGLKYLQNLYPADYEAIMWISKNIKGQPVILEAQGDSYTDYARVSTNTGLPTVLGWTVHEWLWRGSYDIPAPRIPEVQKMYESEDLDETKNLLKKYNVSLVFFGDLEREKHPNLNEEKFKILGKIIYESGNTKIYQIN